MKEVNRFTRGTERQVLPEGEGYTRVHDRDEVLTTRRKMNVHVVAEKLNDVNRGAQLQSPALTWSMIDVLGAHPEHDVVDSGAADLGRFDVIKNDVHATLGTHEAKALVIGLDLHRNEVH